MSAPLTGYQLFLTATFALLAAASAALAAFATRAADRDDRRDLCLLVAALAAVLGLRLWLSTPSFIHANLHGAGLVEGTLDFPRPATFRASYGQFSFFALGAIARAFGRRFEVIVATNQAISVATLGLMAWAARRFTGSRRAAWLVVAGGALHPALVRVAASEDAHNLAVLLAWLALLGVDVHAEHAGGGHGHGRGRGAALLTATAALVLMINTRQTLYAMVPCAALLALGRGGRRLVHDRAWLLAAAAALAGLALRVASTMSEASERTSLVVIGIILTAPSVLADIVLHHPLLDAARFGPLLPVFLVAGVVSCLARGGVQRALAASFLGFFVLTLPFGFRTPGVELSFRLPAVTLGLVVAACGGDRLLARLLERFDAVRVARALPVAAALALAALPALTPGFAELGRVTADTREYLFIRGAIDALPRDFLWVRVRPKDAMPSYMPPLGLLRRAGLRVDLWEPERPDAGRDPRPLLFLDGIQCHAWTLAELIGEAETQPTEVTRALLLRWAPVLFGDGLERGLVERPVDKRRAGGLRTECAPLVDLGAPFGPSATIVAPPDDIPFVVYGAGPVPLRFLRLPPP